MLNKYPLWKYLLIVAVLAIGFIYSAPNLYRMTRADQRRQLRAACQPG
jgi:preprotein translocase subunit SecD